jgi:hypothetical protein
MSQNFKTVRAKKIHFQPSLVLAALALLFFCGASSVASAAILCVDHNGKLGCKTTIGAAVAAASAGDTILVGPGTYKEQVVITKALYVVAFPGSNPTIDATGLANGIFINGMSAAPNTGVADVLISGLTIQNANFEGILVANAYDVTLTGNHVLDNNKALDIAAGACPGIPAFETNEGDDCGEGIHLMGVVASSVVRNESAYNSGGILISDETGPNHDNVISGNTIQNNPFDCGITLASHPPAIAIGPSGMVSFGVFNNTVAHNVSRHNGTQVPGAGAGVGIFAAGPGNAAYGNVVIDNQLLNNGMPGFAMHNHAFAPAPAPPVNLNGNVIVGNYFSGNAADTADSATSGPTGINIYSVAPIYGTVVSQNVFENESIDVAFKAPSSQLSAHFNNFNASATGVDNLGTGTVNATENWWGCLLGPGQRRCATAAGPNVYFLPWLLSPFQADRQ